jgi:hypothetical protein
VEGWESKGGVGGLRRTVEGKHVSQFVEEGGPRTLDSEHLEHLQHIVTHSGAVVHSWKGHHLCEVGAVSLQQPLLVRLKTLVVSPLLHILLAQVHLGRGGEGLGEGVS